MKITADFIFVGCYKTLLYSSIDIFRLSVLSGTDDGALRLEKNYYFFLLCPSCNVSKQVAYRDRTQSLVSLT